VTDKKNKPVLDEQSFEKLLEAAYVLQQDNTRMRELEQRLESRSNQLLQQELENQALEQPGTSDSEERSRSNGDYTLTLAEIVEAQRQIQIHHLGLDNAMAVVAEKVARITNSSGAAIGILEGKTVRYRAGAGAPALPVGSENSLDSAICVASVRTGKVIRSEDVNTEFLFDPELCRKRGILSLLAVPIYHDGDIVGALELYFDRIHGFAEQDIHTCQLMAGLVTEAIGRDAELNLKKSAAAERSTMLAAIERLKPDLAAMADDPPTEISGPIVSASAAAEKSRCWKCGGNVLAQEQFCGNCGAPRAGSGEPSSMQSKFASAWHMQQASKGHLVGPSNGTAPAGATTRWSVAQHHKSRVDFQRDEPADHQPGLFSAPEVEENLASVPFSPAGSDQDAAAASGSSDGQPTESGTTATAHSNALLAPQAEDVVWSSAARARDFLESVSGTRGPGALARFWRSRRGDFYLAVAIILVVAVIRWGIWSDDSVGAAGHGTSVSGNSNRRKQLDPKADLSAFDKLLIGLGLAEAPDAPEYKGNPDTQVWVDLHTALYYCPGSDLYGTTPKGKLSSQRDAQLDQFEPAYRKACD
jgi:putative methionine-R-sulfoxide reductase with GAF domain